MQRNAKFLAEYLKTATGRDFSIEAGTEGKNAIVLALGSEVENPEAYQLKVTDQGVTITAPTEAGVFMVFKRCVSHCLLHRELT